MVDQEIGLLIGAGASFELGMPLVSHLTGEFKGYFTSAHLRQLNARWRQQGGGCDDSVIELIIDLLNRHDLHYENILGCLQTMARRHDQPSAEQYWDMYARMVELVYLLLYYRQSRILPYIRRGFPPFEGLEGFVKQQSNPIWIFSLNHDSMIEILAQHCNIPLRDGFWPDKTMTIRANHHNEKCVLQADLLSEDDLGRANLHLFRTREPGINLIKIHGALDVFATRDGRDLCRLRAVGKELSGRLVALEILNERIGFWQNGYKIRAVNEINYADESGEMQFLRRTLLAGAQKFKERFPQTLPQRMLDLFRSYLNFVHHLYVLGYSFGDTHIDLELRNWLEFAHGRSMVIIDPNLHRLPTQFAHLALQIEILRKTASQFFADYRSIPMTPIQRLEQKVRAALRPFFEKRAARKR
jgi:hypothetical protein